MKLHEALEYCIEHKHYEPFNGVRFMCHALKDTGMPEHIEAVQAKVDSLGTKWRSLSAALHTVGKFEYKADVRGSIHDPNAAQACLDFYEEWIIELTVADQMAES